MLAAYLNYPPALAGGLLSGKVGRVVTVKAARKQATKDMLADW